VRVLIFYFDTDPLALIEFNNFAFEL